ncbi:hypothetical protein Mtc_0734 [Methanocella conradii HZ254]|uniref:Uncharacterized protein n=1 Tax=Methanocella conradii (strain DSM 24694 / JCM 17849 / CGMCC 1.5162 / HZ254) TaxID=1041930 RepID=H8I8M2_METCZ|nr:hypothetical protein [Methanocella conradii]AFC99498.1 hypothetical protein Mtc_0734 [Methanocella conradii HZ254]
MKARTIALLVAAVMLVATTGIGSALAYSWTTTSDGSNDGTEFSYYDGSSNWNHWITQNINAPNGATLTWGNRWHNGYSSAVYYGWQWNAGYAGGSTYHSTDPIRQGGDDRTRDASLTVNLPYVGYTDAVNENHVYSLNGADWYGNDFHYEQKYTRSS